MSQLSEPPEDISMCTIVYLSVVNIFLNTCIPGGLPIELEVSGGTEMFNIYFISESFVQ